MTAPRPARLRVLIAAPLPADVGAVAAVLGVGRARGAHRVSPRRRRGAARRGAAGRPGRGPGDRRGLGGRPGEPARRLQRRAAPRPRGPRRRGRWWSRRSTAGAVDVVGRPLRPLELLARIAGAPRDAGARRGGVGTLPDGLRRGRRPAPRHGGRPRPGPDPDRAGPPRRDGGPPRRRRGPPPPAAGGLADPAAVDPETLRTHLARLNAKLVEAGHPGLRNVRSRGYAIRVEGAAAERWGTMAT